MELRGLRAAFFSVAGVGATPQGPGRPCSGGQNGYLLVACRTVGLVRSLIRRLRAFGPIFQLHWLLGITAGTVLVVIGITGGLMSFQQDILEWLNAEAAQHLESDRARLLPQDLVARYRSAHPDHTVSSLYWRQDRPYPVLLGYRTPETTGRRGERAQIDPFTAEPMAMPRGQWTFGLIRQIHQRLAAGEIGKFIVGVSTITLIVLSVTGLYLRWQRRPRQGWRWLWPRALGSKLAGEWHAVLGLWALIVYLVASLTGLWWSFDWYRDSAKALFASGAHEPHPTLSMPVETLDMARVWSSIAAQMADARSVFIRLPGEADAPVEVHYVPADAMHEYADDELFVHPVSGAILGAERFDDQSAGDKLLASVYALHMGAFFGTPGITIMMIASFAMPVFFVTGWLLYLRRRRMKRQVEPAPQLADIAPAGADALLVAYASQSGLAQRIASRTAVALQQGGVAVRMTSLGELSPACLGAHRQALFVVSTHGEGDAPVAARRFDRHFCGTGEPRLEQLDYALLALGDTDYADSYCAFGRRLDRALRERGARALLTPIEVDKAGAAALDHWHAALAHQFGVASVKSEPAFEHWRLAQRRIMNPDSLGGPTAWLRLQPDDHSQATWQAGDIVEIRARHAPAQVAAWLTANDLDPTAEVQVGETALLLETALADRQLPENANDARDDLQAWLDARPALAARDYSIANIDTGKGIELVVRLARHEHGTGLASGWLVEHAALDTAIDLRLRANPGFRSDEQTNAAPAIFIGNGTGIAGLRSHLQARIRNGQHANWLIFGERERARDFYFADEINAWTTEGALARLDLAFSRDADNGRYVQTALAEQAERLREWADAGATIFVCGSHDGMAPGVTGTLVGILGATTVEAMNDAQRIRMDVY